MEQKYFTCPECNEREEDCECDEDQPFPIQYIDLIPYIPSNPDDIKKWSK
jgi:hypothetical protein